jgi:hypothetical protein
MPSIFIYDTIRDFMPALSGKSMKVPGGVRAIWMLIFTHRVFSPQSR